MRLLSRLTFKITLILLFVNLGDGFMFSAWLRSTTEQNLPMLGQYKYQNYATNEALSAAGVGAHRYVSSKDSGKANAVAIAAAATPPHAFYTSQTDKDIIGIAAYNNQRTGISPPTKYDKPWNTFDAVVVQSIPSAAFPSPSPSPSPSPLPTISYVAIPANNFQYLYYRDEAKAQPAQNIASFTTTLSPQKSVNVELNYKDDTVVEKIGESVVLSQKTPSVALDPAQPATESSVSSTAAISNSSSLSFETDSSSRTNVPNRPIKLLGSNAVYTAPAPAPVPLPAPAPAASTNLTFAPQFYYAPAAADIQYVPYPFLRSPLVTPFLYKNTPRAVSERSEIVPPSPPSASQITNPKPEKPVCENCVPPSALANYSHTFKVLDSNENVAHKPCAQEIAAHPDTAISSTFKSSNMAYILVPSQIIRNRAS